MYYSEEIIENVKSANNIVDVIGLYVPLKKKGSTYFGPCPFHSEKTPSFSVTNTNERHMFYCYGCHAAGDVISFVMKYENLSYVEAIEMLAERAQIQLPKPDYSKERALKEKKRHEITEINREAAVYFYRLLKTERGSKGYAYLKNRGLSNQTITGFGLGFADVYRDDLYKYIKQKGYSDETLKESGLFVVKEEGSRDYFWNRVMFPIMDIRNRVIGFGGRVMGDGEPKYLNSPETLCFNKSQTLYGLNTAKKSQGREIILVEGYMDVISLHQSGFTNAVAGLGTALSDGNVNLLRRYADSVILSYDSDSAGKNAALRAIGKLRSANLAIKVVNLKPYKDPDELIKAEGADAYRQRLDSAMNALLFEIYDMREGVNLGDPDSRTRFYNEISKKIAVFDDEIERDNYITAVSREFFIDQQVLKNAVRRYALTRSGEGIFVQSPRKEKKNNGSRETLELSSKTVLAAAASDRTIYEKISSILSPEDFAEGLYREYAGILFAQRQAGNVDMEQLIDCFTELEEREKAAEIFYYRPENINDAEREQNLSDCVKNLKRSSLERDMSKTAEFSQMISIKKEIEGLQWLKIFD